MRAQVRTLLVLVVLTSCCAITPRTFAQAPIGPDPSRTPGATNPHVTPLNILETICVHGWTQTVRPPEDYTNQLKREQLIEWGYKDQEPRDYEEDYLIPLGLGGDPTSPQNLWPLTLNGRWNAHLKERLEDYLHEQVCIGHMSLGEAQRAIATDWISAYRRYLGEPK